MTLHFLIVFESKKEPGIFNISPHTLTGEDLVGRMGSLIKGMCEDWYDSWRLISVSHSFLPETVRLDTISGTLTRFLWEPSPGDAGTVQAESEGRMAGRGIYPRAVREIRRSF